MNKHSKKDRLLFLKYLSISASCFIGTIITKFSLFAHYGSPFREKKGKMTGSLVMSVLPSEHAVDFSREIFYFFKSYQVTS